MDSTTPIERTGSGYIRAITLALMSRKEENVYQSSTKDNGSWQPGFDYESEKMFALIEWETLLDRARNSI